MEIIYRYIYRSGINQRFDEKLQKKFRKTRETYGTSELGPD